jgi:hypothetical protein
MLAVSRGTRVALTTPFGERGIFFDEWHSTRRWQRIRIPATECPRITAEFLREEREALGERWFRQEYLCSFEDVVGAVFSWKDIQSAMSDDVEPPSPVAETSAVGDTGDNDAQPLFGEGEF